MMKEQALSNFWNSFKILAYAEDNVPDKAPLPYITYQIVTDSFGNNVSMTASIFDKDTNKHSALQFLATKADEIAEAIGFGGVMIRYQNGAIWLRRGTPFAQTLAINDGDTTIKRYILNIQAEYMSAK